MKQLAQATTDLVLTPVQANCVDQVRMSARIQGQPREDTRNGTEVPARAKVNERGLDSGGLVTQRTSSSFHNSFLAQNLTLSYTYMKLEEEQPNF